MIQKIITIVLATALATSTVFAQEATYIEAPTIDIEKLTTEQMIDRAAKQFNQDPKLISKISYCESQHKIKSHDGGRAVNMTGIHDTTFKLWLPRYEKDTGETLNMKSTYDQFKMMSWAFSKGESYRDDWTTYVAYLKGGEYTFYSRLLEGTFTAKCK
jgi:D-alanyl-D-alanine dipeptidase